MLLDVRPILYAPGKQLDFQFDMDLSDLEFYGRFPLRERVRVSGTVRNSADVLTLSLTACAILHTFCDRCGKPLAVKKEVPFSCILAREVRDENNDEIVLLRDGQTDVEELAREAVILNMDTRQLCSEDCKGLCPRCGADWNAGPCSCAKETDSRWAVLATLLHNSEDET